MLISTKILIRGICYQLFNSWPIKIMEISFNQLGLFNTFSWKIFDLDWSVCVCFSLENWILSLISHHLLPMGLQAFWKEVRKKNISLCLSDLLRLAILQLLKRKQERMFPLKSNLANDNQKIGNSPNIHNRYCLQVSRTSVALSCAAGDRHW